MNTRFRKVSLAFATLPIALIALIAFVPAAHAQFPLQIGGNGADRALYSISDGSDGIWMVGDFSSTNAVDFGGTSLTSRGGRDGFAARYNGSGVLQTVIQFGGSGDDQTRGIAIDGSELIICGKFSGTVDFDPSGGTANRTSNGQGDVFLSRYSSTGTFVSVTSFGGANDDTSLDCRSDGAGGAFINGNFELTVDFDPDPVDANNLTSAGGRDIFLARYDGSNALLWALSFGGSENDQTDTGTLAPDGQGGTYIGGFYRGSGIEFAPLGPSSFTANSIVGSADLFVSRYDADGQLVSGFPTLFFQDSGSESVRSITPAAAGGVHVSGYWSQTAFYRRVLDTGGFGAVRFFGGTGLQFGVGAVPDGAGGLIMFGLTNTDICVGDSCNNPADTLFNAGMYDTYVVQMSTAGNYLGGFILGGDGEDFGATRFPVVDGNGDFFLTGRFSSTVNFGGREAGVQPEDEPAGPELTSNGDEDIFLTKYPIDLPLAVELTDFRGQRDGSDVLLSWETASEIENLGFEIEIGIGQIDVGGGWRSLGFVQGKGTSNSRSTYSFRASETGVGKHRYRLKQMDASGGVSYSAIVEVDVALDQSFRIGPAYPNPLNETATVQLSVRDAQHVTVSLHDATGRRISTVLSQLVSSSGARTLEVDASELAAGLYFLRTEGEAFVDVQYLLVAR